MRTSKRYNAGGGSALHLDNTSRSISELEHLVSLQREQLSEAVQYLQEAAYLAHYHQPSLERNIRAFLNAIQA